MTAKQIHKFTGKFNQNAQRQIPNLQPSKQYKLTSNKNHVRAAISIETKQKKKGMQKGNLRRREGRRRRPEPPAGGARL